MTTHYQKIQALGNRMASNLETMGVSASFNDGGLTLADKILQIQRFNDGIILYGDKIIAQSADTVNLYALLLDDKIPQSGETVKFYADKILVTDTASPGDSLYEDYYVTSEKTGSSWDYIGSGSTGFIQFNSEKINTYHPSWSGEVSHNGDKIHIKDGVLTYHDTSDVEQTIDVSAIDTTKAYTTAAFTVYYYWVEATTGSNGVANYQYTCTGAGKINFSAKSGGIVSQTYSIWDTLFHDEMTPYDSSKWSSTITPVQADDGVIITESTGTSAQFNSNFTAIEDTVIEFDAIGISTPSNSVRFYYKGADNYISSYLTDNNEHHFKFVCSNGTIIPYVDGVAKSSKSTTSATGCRFILNNASIKFRNFKIYSV